MASPPVKKIKPPKPPKNRRRPTPAPTATATPPPSPAPARVVHGGGATVAKNQLQTKYKWGTILHIVSALVCGGVVALLLTFGWQSGLSIEERCYCSWNKVIAFSVGSALTVFLQMFTYYTYRNKCEEMSKKQVNEKTKFRNQQLAFIARLVLIPLLICVAIVFFLLPLFLDQNGNILWIFQKISGIIAFSVTILMTIATGILLKLACSQQV